MLRDAELMWDVPSRELGSLLRVIQGFGARMTCHSAGLAHGLPAPSLAQPVPSSAQLGTPEPSGTCAMVQGARYSASPLFYLTCTWCCRGSACAELPATSSPVSQRIRMWCWSAQLASILLC